MRLAAGAALLRLARCHDGSIPPLTYCALALTMQVHSSQLVAPDTFHTKSVRGIDAVLSIKAHESCCISYQASSVCRLFQHMVRQYLHDMLSVSMSDVCALHMHRTRSWRCARRSARRCAAR